MFSRESLRKNLNDPEIAVSKQLRKREASIPSKYAKCLYMSALVSRRVTRVFWSLFPWHFVFALCSVWLLTLLRMLQTSLKLRNRLSRLLLFTPTLSICLFLGILLSLLPFFRSPIPLFFFFYQHCILARAGISRNVDHSTPSGSPLIGQ